MPDPFELGPIKIGVELDTSGISEDLEQLLNEDDLERIESLTNAFAGLSDQMSFIVNGMFDVSSMSQNMAIVVSSSFRALDGVISSTGRAWQQMLLTGEISAATFGQAMQSMVAQELAAISASSLVNAIYATAIGFLRLATFLPGPAVAAFTAAATFAAVAAVAGAGALALSTGGGGSGGITGGLSKSGTIDARDNDRIDEVQTQNQRRFLHLEVHGNIFGQAEYIREQFLPELNSLVMEDDALVVVTNQARIQRTTR